MTTITITYGDLNPNVRDAIAFDLDQLVDRWADYTGHGYHGSELLDPSAPLLTHATDFTGHGTWQGQTEHSGAYVFGANFTPSDSELAELRGSLVYIAKYYNQDAIGIAVARPGDRHLCGQTIPTTAV